MGSMGKFTASDLKKLQKQLNKIQAGDVDAFVEGCAKELAARLLSKVIKRTPVGDYPKSSGKKGGTLRRGWTSQQSGSGSEGMKTSGAAGYVDSLKINHYGGFLVIEIVNRLSMLPMLNLGIGRRIMKDGFKGGSCLRFRSRRFRRSPLKCWKPKSKSI